MARPKKENHPISIRMDKAIYDRLNAFCQASGQPKTVAIERALEAYINRYADTPLGEEMRKKEQTDSDSM